jgi:hypothetical protein
LSRYVFHLYGCVSSEEMRRDQGYANRIWIKAKDIMCRARISSLWIGGITNGGLFEGKA